MENNNKHTPGAWKAHTLKTAWVDVDAGYGLIADVYEKKFPGETAANARLIAAAPDAHEILLAINEFFRHHNPVNPSAMMDDSRTFAQAVQAYLAKVEGGDK